MVFILQKFDIALKIFIEFYLKIHIAFPINLNTTFEEKSFLY